MPVHVSKLLPLLGWYAGMLKSFQLESTKTQLTVVSNLSELHKAHKLHHWRLVGIPMISQEVKHANASTMAIAICVTTTFRIWMRSRKVGMRKR